MNNKWGVRVKTAVVGCDHNYTGIMWIKFGVDPADVPAYYPTRTIANDLAQLLSSASQAVYEPFEIPETHNAS